MNLPSSRIPWLDNIRVFACILVIASHIVGQFFVSPPFTPDNETFAWSSFIRCWCGSPSPCFS